MTLEELETLCKDSEEFWKNDIDKAYISLMVPGIRKGKTVRVCKGLTGDNFGIYGQEDIFPSTMVSVKTTKLRKFLNGLKFHD